MKEAELAELNKLHEDVDKMGEEELDEVIVKYKIKSPETGNDLSKSYKFNLMFETQIGPTGGVKGYLRPETAQGHFVNFRKLLEFNGGKVPFASASIGLGFRNEISPRSGLLRVREFTMAEIEHYVDPDNKSHKKFANVKDLKLPLLSAKSQKAGTGIDKDVTLGKAVADKIIDNETLAYFLARTYLFLTTVGVSKDGVRFRQHTEKEMAHYASDCWDAEIETSYGWYEVVGHADRTCYDLKAHTEASGIDLKASRQLAQPVIKKQVRATLNKNNLAKSHKDKMKSILGKLEKLTEEEKQQFLEQYNANGKFINLEVDGQQLKLGEDMVKFEIEEIKEFEQKYIPGVIEPSFGIGRLTYCVLEHCFKVREKDEQRTYFTFPPIVAPVKVSILPLISSDELNKFVEPISKMTI